MATRYASGGSAADELPAGHRPLAFDLDRAARRQPVAVAQQLVRALGDLDRPGQRVGLHAAGGVHRVAPEVVDELRPADDTGDDGAGGDPDANVEVDPGP